MKHIYWVYHESDVFDTIFLIEHLDDALDMFCKKANCEEHRQEISTDLIQVFSAERNGWYIEKKPLY